MAVPYKNPISSVQVSTPLSVSRTSVFGTNFSNLNVGGYMEVYNLSDLSLTLTATSYPSLIQLSANTIPIRYTKGNGTFLSPDYLTLNSDNISSGRRRLGMMVYVHETDKVYQYVIPNYDTLWNNLSGLTGFSSVTYSDYTTVINSRSSAGQSFISGWTSSNIEGVGGYTSANANWRIFQSGSSGGTSSGAYLPLSGGTVTGPTIFTSGVTANTISATTYQNLPPPVITGTTNYIPKFTSGTTLTNSLIYDSFSGTGINTATPIAMLDIKLSATTDYILNLKDVSDNEFFRINKAGGIFINTGATAYGAFLPTHSGIYINGDGSTSYGANVYNKNIITFMQTFTSGAISGIQAATLNYGNVRCGLYFQNNTSPRPELFGTTVVGGVAVETFRITEAGSFNIGGLNTDNSRFTIKNSRLTLGSKAFSILNSASTENIFFNDNGNAIFNGGLSANTLTVTGNTSLQGLTATTISATTYQNLPTDIRVTGVTYSNNTFTYRNNTGGTFSVLFNTVTGLTANTLTVTGNTSLQGVTATTISATTYQNLPSITGLYLPISGGTVTGQTFFSEYLTVNNGLYANDISSYNGYSQSNDFGDSYFGYNNGDTNTYNRIQFNSTDTSDDHFGTVYFAVDPETGLFLQNNSGLNTDYSLLAVSETLLQFSLNSNSGLTNNNFYIYPDYATFDKQVNSNVSFVAPIFSATTYSNLPLDIRVTGATYSNNTFTYRNNTGGTFNVLFNTVTGLTANTLTVTGNTSLQGLTATTISATTYQNLPTEVFVTGATYSNNTFTYRNNTGETFNVLFNTVTGLTVNGNLTVTGNTTSTNFSGNSDTISGTKGTVTTSGSSTTAFINVSGSNTVGGTGYTDFIRVTNTAAGATNPNKTIRVNNTGGIEFINSAYNSSTLTLSDNGNLSVGGGNTASVTSNDASTNYLSFNLNNTQFYDDGNTHIHARGNGNPIWINTNNAGIIIGGQSPVAGGGAATGIIMGSGSTTIRAFANIYGGKTYAIGGYGYLATIGAGTGAGTTATYGLYVQQRVEASEFDATSDERLKNIQGEIELDDAIKLVNNLKPIKFTWKDKESEGIKTGYSAQQVVKSGFNHLISHIPNEDLKETTDDEGFTSPKGFQLTMGYDQVTPYHGVVIKHLLEQIELLKEEIRELKNK